VTDVDLISKFDPWDSTLCTCPPKLTFNPYTGCDHACIYCYASSYIPKFSNCRPKKDLVPRLKREAAGLRGEIVSIANSSDPYPNIEAEWGLTRKCLEILSNCDCKLQMITKSDLVVRDIDLLRKVPSMVSLTITTDDDKVARIIEPQAPSPSQRLKAARTLIERNIPTSVRIDPIIPFINDNPETLMKTLARMGVKHVTCSTYKIKRDNWQRFKLAYPEIAKRLEPFYFEKGEKIGGYTYLPRKLRLELMMAVRGLAEKYGMHFGVCREGLSHLNAASCDGSWMLYE
jgi:DNA repair photolyase